MTDEEELASLEELRLHLDKRISALKKRINSPTKRTLSGSLWIQTSVLIPFISDYLAEYSETIVGLADKANVSSATIKNILSSKTFWTSEVIAEALLVAMDLPHILAHLPFVKLTREEIRKRPPSHYFEE